MKLGIVDLDTSHPADWIPIERELGHEIAGVWDGGAVHPADYISAFAARHAIPRVYDRLSDMVDDVDCAILHGCDWDTHVEKARPFVEAGRAVLIDKPLAGNARDLRQIVTWIEQGARIQGGSALRFCGEVRDWLAVPESGRGTPHTVFCGCAVDEFNYGIHAFSFASLALGPGIRHVRHLGTGVQQRVLLDWSDGRMAILAIGEQGGWLPHHISIVTDRTAVQFIPDVRKLYRAMLETVLPWLAGEGPQPPLGPATLVEPELAALAALESAGAGGANVALAAISDATAYDGKRFAARYRRKR